MLQAKVGELVVARADAVLHVGHFGLAQVLLVKVLEDAVLLLRGIHPNLVVGWQRGLAAFQQLLEGVVYFDVASVVQ